MKAMILAAGRGERMRPLTDSTPKALLPVGEKRLIEYHLNALAAAGISDVVVNIAWLGEQLREYLDDGRPYGLEIHYSQEPEGALETGGGIFQALPLLGPGPFWLINGDIRTHYPIQRRGLAADDLGSLVLVPNPDHHSGGDFGLTDGRIVNTAGSMHTYSGMAILRPELFSEQSAGRFPLAPLLRDAAAADQLGGELYTGVWMDVGTPERLALAAQIQAD